MIHNLDDVNCILDFSNNKPSNKPSNNQNYVINVEIAEESSDSETSESSYCSKTVSINKEEHDKRCAKYSTASFLLGICGIVIWGIANLKPQQ